MLMASGIPTRHWLHRSMFAAREIDRVEQGLVRQGLAHFHVSGAGHEFTALVADHLHDQDWLHLRDKALLVARGLPIACSPRSGRLRPCTCGERPVAVLQFAGGHLIGDPHVRQCRFLDDPADLLDALPTRRSGERLDSWPTGVGPPTPQPLRRRGGGGAVSKLNSA